MDASLVTLIFLVVLLLAVIGLVARFTKPKLDKNYFFNHWQKISDETSYLSQLISADKLLDEALKRSNVQGATMGERLRNSQTTLQDINSIWWAHKLRNQAVHEPDKQISKSEINRALHHFHRALKNLGAL